MADHASSDDSSSNAHRAVARSSADALRAEAQRLAFAPLLFQAARLLRDTGLLAALVDAPAGLAPTVLATSCGLSLYATRVLLEAGLAIGLVESDGTPDGAYRLTRIGRLVLRDPITRANMDFVHDVCAAGALGLEEALRDGRPAGLRALGGDWPTIYDGLSSLSPAARRSWLAFDHLYSDSAFDAAITHLLARGPLGRLLDVGGNTGRFALRCLARDPSVRVTTLDLPGQIAMQPRVPRLESIPFDLLDHARPFPDPFDIVWMSQVVSCFSDDDMVSILRRARSALAPGGRVVVLETYWDHQTSAAARVSLQASSLYFAAIANGRSKMVHSADLARDAARAVLSLVDEVRPLGISHTLQIFR